MSKAISGSVLGGDISNGMEAGTPTEVFGLLNVAGETREYTVMVNGETASMDQSLSDGDFVTFTKAQKGASWGRTEDVPPPVPATLPTEVVFDTPILNITRLAGGTEYRVNGTKVSFEDITELCQILIDETNDVEHHVLQ